MKNLNQRLTVLVAAAITLGISLSSSAAENAAASSTTVLAAPATASSAAAPTVGAMTTTTTTVTTTTTTVTTATEVTPEEVRRAHYKVQALYSTYLFNEAGVKKTSGNLAGFNIGGEYNLKATSQMLTWGIEYFTGTPTFEGSSSATGASLTKKSDDNFYTFGGGWGARKQIGETTSSVDGNLGLSYRYLDSHVRDRGVVQNEQVLWFVPVTVGFDHRLNSKLQLRASIENDLVLIGQSRQHYTDLNAALPVAKLTESSGSGTKLSIGARRLLPDLDISGEIYYRNWQVAESNSVSFINKKGDSQVAFEAANSTEMFGLGLGVAY